MEVKLIAYTQPVSGPANPMAIVEEAACVCYNSTPSPDFKVAKGCKLSGHTSVYEHISFVFHVKGVSRALLAQITRHRHAGFSVRSQRYNNEFDFDFVNPISEPNKYHDYFDEYMRDINAMYYNMTDAGIAAEDARAVLPNACCTELVISANARALMEMSHLRLCNRAQKEIRELFQMFKTEVSGVCPEVAAAMVPSCEIHARYPFCPEFKCCGKHPKLKDVYNPVVKMSVSND